jgi:uncharacterized membrane protein YcaP (DUF421 family)
MLILSRMLGKKQLSQLTFFNYITGITIGSVAANAINMYLYTTIDDYIALIVFCILTIISGFISLKSVSLRTIIDGEPTIVIKKGKINERALNKLKLNIDDLNMLLREKNIFSITEVYYALLETNGKLSVLKNEPEKQVTKKEINIYEENPDFIPTKIIVDGQLIRKNLKELNLSESWIKRELKNKGIDKYKEILYAEVLPNKSIYIKKKSNHN